MSNGGKLPVLYTRGASLRAYFSSDLSSGGTLSTGLWQYITFNRSGTNILNFYKNGTLTSSSPTSSGSLGSSGIMTIGQNGDSSQYWSGIIDEVRLSSVARPINWIKFEYCNMLSIVSGTCAGNNETIFANQEIYEE